MENNKVSPCISCQSVLLWNQALLGFYSLPKHKDSPVLSGEAELVFEKQLKSTLAILSLDVFMKMNGHDWIDVLKIDIEGSEFDIFENISGKQIKATHLLIEFHARFVKDGVSRQKAIYERIESFGFEKVFEGSYEQEVIFRE
jgi:FkbM family methyltransferase